MHPASLFLFIFLGPEDFEGTEVPIDVNRGMFLLDASLQLREAARLQNTKEKVTCCTTFKTKLYTFLSMFCSNLIEEHQWLSIATVPDAHPFTPVQRLWVVWIMTLTNFAVIGKS